MVLFISRKKRHAVDAANLFKKLQIIAYGTSAKEALSEISPNYHAAVLIYPEEFPDYEDYVNKIHAYDRGMPVFALCDHPEKLRHPEIFARIESNDIRSADFASKILKYAKKHKLPPIGMYKVRRLEAPCYRTYMTFYGIRLDFTKTEAKILRYLMATDPFPQNATSILKYAYPPAKRPEPATIRTHISTLNKKFANLFPSIQFIIHVPNEGYRIRLGK